MSDRMRITGMSSGLDTESIVQQLVAAKQVKVTNLKNEQKKLEWKQNAWQDLNAKIYNFYSNTLSKLRLTGAYKKKSTSCSDTTKASVTANANAVDGTQTLEVKKTAKSGYLTGSKLMKTELGYEEVKGTKDTKLEDLGIQAGTTFGISVNTNAPTANATFTIDAGETVDSFMKKVNDAAAAEGYDIQLKFDEDEGVFTIEGPSDGSKFKLTQGTGATDVVDALGLGEVFKYDNSTTGTHTGSLFRKPAYVQTEANFTASDRLSNIAPDLLVGHTITVKTGTGENAKETQIEITKDMTISDLVSKLKDAGLTASFDEENQRFYISSKASGAANDFSITDDTEDDSVLTALGFVGGDSTKVAAQDAEIVLNGATYTSDTNTFSVNGLTITATGVTDGEITITTATDYKSSYDTIKEFLSEYNALINEIDSLYNAESARKYTMLSDDEKEAMTDDEVEKWEDTIKGALLRKDTQLGSVMNSLTQSMLKSFRYDGFMDGRQIGLSTFGVKTLGYFTAKDFEHYAYHIDGDEDDEDTRDETDELMKMLTSNPEETIQFFADLCKNVYDELDKTMSKTSEYSSIYKVYNDKQLQKDYDNYTKKIKEAEEKLSDYEDKWYDKFSKMESALAKMQSNQSIVSSMLGLN